MPFFRPGRERTGQHQPSLKTAAGTHRGPRGGSDMGLQGWSGLVGSQT